MSILVFFREKQRNPRHNYLAIPTLLSTVWQSFLWCGCKVADSFFFPFFEGGVESGEAGRRRRRRTRQETTFCLSESNTTYNPTSSCSPLLGCFVYSMRKFFPLPYRISPDVHSASKNKQNFKQCLFLFLAGPKWWKYYFSCNDEVGDFQIFNYHRFAECHLSNILRNKNRIRSNFFRSAKIWMNQKCELLLFHQPNFH